MDNTFENKKNKGMVYIDPNVGDSNVGADDEYGTFVLFWKSKSFRIPLPSPSTTLRELRRLVYKYTGVLPQQQKLIHSGAVLKDEDEPLSTYQIYYDSWGGSQKEKRIALIENVRKRTKGEEGKEERESCPAHLVSDKFDPDDLEREEASAKVKIERILRDFVSQLDNEVEAFELETEQWIRKRMEMTAYLEETLVQALIDVDTVHVPESFVGVEVRKTRKKVVRRIQSLLEKVDGLKQTLQSAITASSSSLSSLS